jgi:hypothetical protein
MMHNQSLGDDAPLRRYEYDDSVVFVGDLGSVGDASVDVVGHTAIVVADGEQHDIELPGGASQAFIHNGVLTIEVTTELENTEA